VLENHATLRGLPAEAKTWPGTRRLAHRIDEIALELHDWSESKSLRFNADAQRIFEMLATHFMLCRVHANNFCTLRILAGCFPIPETLELTYIRSALVTRTPSRTGYPTTRQTYRDGDR
jgi:hypothetical protein